MVKRILLSLSLLISPASTVAEDRSKDLFFSQEVDKNSAYVGENILNTLDLHFATMIVEPKIDDLTYDGFWSEPIGKEQNLRQFVDGVSYNIIRLRRLLFPLRPGALSIPPRHIDLKVRERVRQRQIPVDPFDIDPLGQDILDDFLSVTRFRDVKLTSNSIILNIRPLPKAPTDLTGWDPTHPLVGKTEIRVKYNSNEVKVGEGKTVEITVTSFGNLAPFSTIPLSIPSWVRRYDETPESKNVESGGRLISRKAFSFSLVPTRGGEVVIPPIRLAYFDPEQKEYQLASGGEIRFSVVPAPGESVIQEPTPVPTVESIKTPVTTGPIYEEKSTIEKFSERVSSGLLVYITTLFLLVYLAYRYAKSRRAGYSRHASTRKGIANASSISELRSALNNALSSGLGITQALATKEEIRKALRLSLHREDILLALDLLMDDLDEALYGGQSDGFAELNSFKERATTILNKLSF